MKMSRTSILFLVIVFLASLLLMGRGVHAKATPITFTGGEFLGRPTANSITINIIPDEDIDVYYEYGTSPGVYGATTPILSATGGEPHEIVISGLAPNTRYYYRMQYQQPGETTWIVRDEHSFHTQRLSGSTFTFTIIADSHMNGGGGNGALYEQTLDNVKDDNPDFHLDLGDTFFTDDATTVASTNQKYLAQRVYMGAISHSVPIFIATGNHENEEGWNFDDTPSKALLSINARKLYYPNPITDGFYSGNDDISLGALVGDGLREDYYAWEWGDALFIVIDPFQYTMTKPYTGTAGGEVDDEIVSGDSWNWTLGEQQYLWFKNVLETSDAKYKFVFAHHVVGGMPSYLYVRGGAEAVLYYEWGGNNWSGTWQFDTERPGWESPIHQLMVANHVSAFFHGHDHEYAYEVRDGIVYQLVPQPGNTGYGFGLYNESDPYTEKVLPSPGHLRVTVSPEEATVEYIGTSSGTSNYTYTIEPNEVELGILGDVNGDELVNSTDALIVLSCDVGIDTSAFCPMNRGDVNGDGFINSTDALIILSYDVGISVPYPVGEPGYPSDVTPCPGCGP